MFFHNREKRTKQQMYKMIHMRRLKIPKNIVVRTGKILYNPYVERMRGGKTALVQKTKGEQPL